MGEIRQSTTGEGQPPHEAPRPVANDSSRAHAAADKFRIAVGRALAYGKNDERERPVGILVGEHLLAAVRLFNADDVELRPEPPAQTTFMGLPIETDYRRGELDWAVVHSMVGGDTFRIWTSRRADRLCKLIRQYVPPSTDDRCVAAYVPPARAARLIRELSAEVEGLHAHFLR